MIKVLLVNEKDEIIGEEEKLTAHRLGLLHRAFSIFLVDPGTRRILIQRRSAGKYHSGGKLSNTCCSHPYADERIGDSLKRCMLDELGEAPDIPFREVGSFHYFSDYGTNSEHEIDHVYIGYITERDFPFNPEEIESLHWMTREEVEQNMDQFTSWFLPAYRLATEAIDNTSK